MNPVAQNQTINTPVVYFLPQPEAKLCSSCNSVLPDQEALRRTSFGLQLCDDCLYA